MLIDEKEIILKSGKKVLIKSATKKYAESLCNHRYVTASESYFMAGYPEEMNLDIDKMKNNLLTLEKDEKDFLITAFLDGKIIGDAGITKIRDQMKYGHRAYFGISILKEFCNEGLGMHMLSIALEQAKKNGFEQVELGVFEDNLPAIALYEKCGFKKFGVQPRAFKLKDGTYRDEIIMVHFFK
ncbi:MAG: GNAT family N-acetyltransferase [Sarcina sp.]